MVPVKGKEYSCMLKGMGGTANPQGRKSMTKMGKRPPKVRSRILGGRDVSLGNEYRWMGRLQGETEKGMKELTYIHIAHVRKQLVSSSARGASSPPSGS